MQFSVKQRLFLGFGVLLALLAVVTVVGQYQLATVRSLNNALDERALRISLATDWATAIKVAVAAGAPVPAADSEPIRKLKTLVQADDEKSALATAAASHDASPQEHSKAVDAFVARLVSLQVADSAVLQSALSTAVTTVWACLVLGLIAGIVLAMRTARSLIDPLNQAIAVTEKVAEGDLTQAIDTRRHDEVGQMLAALAKMQGKLSHLVAQVRSGSESVATASTEIAQGNNDLSSRTEQQAAALEQTSASMTELGSTVRQNADSARMANQLAQSASSIASEGGRVVGEVVNTMRDINEASRKISDIIQVIDGIAFQANILALNAAVEAARAGEQGRGFAVVAGEVRALAGRSAEAAKEIKQLINASVEKVELGSSLVDQAGTTMGEVVASIQRVTDIMGEISAASTEQSQGVQQVGEAVSQMDQGTQRNAALVEEMAAAASSLQHQAQELVQVVAAFRIVGGASSRTAPAAAPHARPAAAPRPAPALARTSAAPLIKGKAKPAAPAKTAALPPAKAAAGQQPAPKPAAPKANQAAAHDEGDWETF